MYYYIRGELAFLAPTFAVIDAGGVGYRLAVSSTTHEQLSRLEGAEKLSAKLFTYLIVREDLLELCGFFTEEEKALFELLITVSGVGPKAAMSVLSELSPGKLVSAVSSGDAKSISRASGIGPKTAARIILELKDKISRSFTGSESISADIHSSYTAQESSKLEDVENALSVLGFSKSDISAAVSGIDIANTELEEIIRMALARFSR